MDFIKNGTRIKTVIGDLKAIIIGFNVIGDQNPVIEYKLSWVANGDHKTTWMFSFEIELDIDNKKPAGFKNYEQESNKLIS